MRTLSRKMLLGQTIAVALVMVLLGTASAYIAWSEEHKRLDESTDRVISRLQLALAAPVRSGSRDTANAVASAELLNPDVVGVIVNDGPIPWIMQGVDETQVDDSMIVANAELVAGKSLRLFVSTRSAVAALQREATTAGIELAVVLVAIMLVNMGLFRRIVTRPIRSVVDRLKHIAEGDGDLSMTIDHTSNDEIGELVVAFNTFIEQLRNVVESSRAGAEKIAAATERLNDEGNKQTATADALLTAARAIDRTMETLQSNSAAGLDSGRGITGRLGAFETFVHQQNSATEESSAAVEEMLASITALAGKVEDRRGLARQLADNAAGGHERARSVQEHMQEVMALSDRVAEMTGVIKGIAEQTNLLSLNAAIEAAHAGDAGHGFAVVAEEIRKLADTSAEQSASISDAVGQIINEIRRAGEAAGRNSHVFDEMVGEVGIVVSAFEEVTQSLHELSTGSNQIRSAMFDLRNAASALDENRRGISESAETILGALGEEARLVNETKSQSGEITAEADGLERQTRAIALLIEEARVAVDNLQLTFRRFSTNERVEELGVELKPGIALE